MKIVYSYFVKQVLLCIRKFYMLFLLFAVILLTAMMRADAGENLNEPDRMDTQELFLSVKDAGGNKRLFKDKTAILLTEELYFSFPATSKNRQIRVDQGCWMQAGEEPYRLGRELFDKKQTGRIRISFRACGEQGQSMIKTYDFYVIKETDTMCE